MDCLNGSSALIIIAVLDFMVLSSLFASSSLQRGMSGLCILFFPRRTCWLNERQTGAPGRGFIPQRLMSMYDNVHKAPL